MIVFTELLDKLKYPSKIKGRLSTQHSNVVDYVIQNYQDSKKFRQKVVDALNMLSYCMLVGDSFPDSWSMDSPLDNLPEINPVVYKKRIGDLFLTPKDLIWDIDISEKELAKKDLQAILDFELPPSEPMDQPLGPNLPNILRSSEDSSPSVKPTKIDDLVLTGPIVPTFDTSKVYVSGVLYEKPYCIYYSVPYIPTRQCEISVTTNIEEMSDNDFLRLFPTKRFELRRGGMYDDLEGVTKDPLLGLILPIEGFTEEEVRDNIVKYPHIEYITRRGKSVKTGRDVFRDFWTRIEIDGVLYKTVDVWKDLPDVGRFIPTVGLVAEYVVRRYLLERDIKHVDHNYKMFGDLDPFLTLFMPTVDYINLGYTDVIGIGRQCVESRVKFLRSRNPVIRRLEEELHE